jgi:hypothetical protein
MAVALALAAKGTHRLCSMSGGTAACSLEPDRNQLTCAALLGVSMTRCVSQLHQ